MFQPKKSLGQNFLTDPNSARKITESMNVVPGDVVVEIGPGKGVLTSLLAPAAAHLYVVEIDERAVAYLRKKFDGEENISVVHEDFLHIDLLELSRRHGRRLRIIGNIPYYITTPILFHVLDQREAVSDLQMMMQKEVALRLGARPSTKEYGILAVITALYGPAEILFTVSPNAFYPKPSVQSAVVRMTLRRTIPCTTGEEKNFRNLVRLTFGKRRKMLRSALKSAGVDAGVLESLPFDLGRRPEELGVEDFLTLTRELMSRNSAPSFPGSGSEEEDR